MRRKATVQMVQADLKEIGVVAHARFLDFNVLSENLKAGKEDAWVAGWGSATYVDPTAVWHTEGKGFRNYCLYSNPKVDDLIERGRGTAVKEAMPIWKEFQQILYKEQPYTILYEPRGLNAIHKRYNNVESNALDYWFNLDEWFVPEGMQKATK